MRYYLAVLILTCILTSGCSSNGARETDEVAWVISMGIDKAADGDLLVSYRIANPQAQAGGPDGGGGGETSILTTIKAPSLAEARNLLNASMPRSVSLTHVTIIVIGEDLARAGVQGTIGPIMRFREFRGTTFLAVCRGKAQDLYKANNPQLETLISRWVHNYMHNYIESSYHLDLTIHQFYNRLKASSGAPLAVGYGLNPLSGQDRGTGARYTGKVDAYLPGDLPREGGNTTEFTGTAVFKSDKLAGFLDTGETRVLSILLNQFSRGFIAVDDPLAPKHQVTASIRNGRKPKIDIDISGEDPVININVLLEGEITGLPSGINYESKEYLTLLEAQISNSTQEQIANMLSRTQSWGTDVANFGLLIRPKFMTMNEMRDYEWGSRYPHATINVKVNTELRRTGLMRRSLEIRKD